MSQIQFKKLVWEPYRMGWWTCKTPLFTFHVIEVDDNEFMLCIDSLFNTRIHQDESFTTREGAKQGGQEWLEQQLSQFIETSENAAQ